FGSLSFAAILLYAASVACTIGYDTIYAHQDKEDDELIGAGESESDKHRQQRQSIKADQPLPSPIAEQARSGADADQFI
ncbi:hypothetical protein ACC736_39625, partial [Rhizobium ruizarguesonis]